MQPSKEVVDVIEELCDYEIGAFVDLCFQMFDFFVFAESTPSMPVRVG